MSNPYFVSQKRKGEGRKEKKINTLKVPQQLSLIPMTDKICLHVVGFAEHGLPVSHGIGR